MVETQPEVGAIAGMAVVTLPDEIDVVNADRVGEDLQAAFGPGVTTVVADMTATTFCDSRGIAQLVLAGKQADACGAEFRVVVPSAAVLRVLAVLGLDSWLAIYPSLQEALATEPAEGT
jgi:anti-sigma B factor antagonist